MNQLFSFDPHKKLKTKQILVLSTISLFILLLGLILQITIPLGDRVSGSQVASILWPIIFGVILLFWFITFPLVILWINNLHYFVEEDRIRIHKGILSKIQQNIPYKAVTDFILHRSLYDRLLGLGSIRIQTAGQSATATGYEGNIAGLIEWENIYDELRKILIRKKATMGITGVEEPESEEEILKEILTELREIKEQLKK